MDAEALGLLSRAADTQSVPAPSPLPLQEKPSRPLSPRANQIRRRMIAKVRSFWITGVLEQSLHGAALIALGLYEQPDAVENPWQLVFQSPNQPARPLPSNTRITQVYDDVHGELLVLGEPGSGKTTLLLELARDLLDRAEHDDTHPIPVVFNLSSWSVKQPPLAEWLFEELNTKYQVPRQLGQSWVDADQILPLLDGLDEVTSPHRSACVDTINACRREHGMIPTVVCSRSAEYFAQTTQVLLRNAVIVQPLTLRQIDDYLSSVGGQLDAVHLALRDDPALQELATTPLMLSVLTLAYQGKSVDDLQLTSSPATLQQQIFSDYVQRMFLRRSSNTRYLQRQVMSWLSWLTRQMQERGQTAFYIEQLQPDWLPQGWTRDLYQSMVFRFFVGLLVGFIYGLDQGLVAGIQTYIYSGFIIWLCCVFSCALAGGLIIGPCYALSQRFLGRYADTFGGRLFSGLLSSIIGAFFIGFLMWLPYRWLIMPGIDFFYGGLGGFGETASPIIGLMGILQWKKSSPVSLWSWTNIRRSILQGIAIGVISGGVSGLIVGIVALVEGVPGALVVALRNMEFFGVPSVLFAIVVAALVSERIQEIHPVEVVKWSWAHVRPSALRGLLFGLIIGALAPLGIGLAHSALFNVIFGVLFALLGSLFAGILGGISGGVSWMMLDEGKRVLPNEAIRRSARNSQRAGMLGAIICIIIFSIISLSIVVIFHFYDELLLDLVTSFLIGGFLGWLAGAWWGGGFACIQHLLLRFFLREVRAMPLAYATFLDYATERILLRKIGGGYIFIHHLLQDYFASLVETGAVYSRNRKLE